MQPKSFPLTFLACLVAVFDPDLVFLLQQSPHYYSFHYPMYYLIYKHFKGQLSTYTI